MNVVNMLANDCTCVVLANVHNYMRKKEILVIVKRTTKLVPCQIFQL